MTFIRSIPSVETPMLRQHVPIDTVRLSLRLFTFDDSDAVYRWHRDPDVTQYTGGVRSVDQSLYALVRWVQRFTTQGWGGASQQNRYGLPGK